MTPKKNILLAVADDASHFGCYGHRFVHTPTIDRLAEEGIRFDRAFTCNPKCAPSRASILTGKYSWQLREAMNHSCIFPAGERFLPDYLEDAGYFVGFTGKGWAPGDFSAYPRNPAGPAYNELKTPKQEGTGIKPCDYVGNFKQFLQKKPENKPFYFWFGCHEPHRPYVSGEGKNVAPLSEVDVPSYLPDDPIVRADFLDYAHEIQWFDRQLGEMVSHLKERGEYENTLILVLSDNGCPFPRIKGQMYEQDFRLPLVASCPALVKQGGRVASQIVNFVDLLPTVLDYAGVSAGSTVGHSFLPLLTGAPYEENDCAYFGREKHDTGRENDLGYPVRCIRTDRHLLVYNFEPSRYPAGKPETGFTNCDSSPTKDRILALAEQGDDRFYRLAFGKRPQIELYDVKKDPECLENLAKKEEYATTVKELTERLFSFLIKTNDPRILVDRDYFDKMPLLTDRKPYSWYAYTHGCWQKQTF